MAMIVPHRFHQAADPVCMCRDVDASQFLDRSDRGRWSNRFRPIGARDKRRLCRVHHLAATNNRGHRMSVADRFRKHRNIGINRVLQMDAAQVHPPTGRNLVEDQQCAVPMA